MVVIGEIIVKNNISGKENFSCTFSYSLWAGKLEAFFKDNLLFFSFQLQNSNLVKLTMVAVVKCVLLLMRDSTVPVSRALCLLMITVCVKISMNVKSHQSVMRPVITQMVATTAVVTKEITLEIIPRA